MKPKVLVNFALQWPDFTFDVFRRNFPYVFDVYDVEVSDTPEIVFYSVYAEQREYLPDGQYIWRTPIFEPGRFVRVFFCGENCEPDMGQCDFAMTTSSLVRHPRHLRLPVWLYSGRAIGVQPNHLVRDPRVDVERIAAGRTKFCNFIYGHSVKFRDDTFAELSRYKHVDAAGPCMNNMSGGWRLPGWSPEKIEFMRSYKFTLAVENSIWPGYSTEKLIDPILAYSIPIYVGDPQAARHFDDRSFISFTNFATMAEMFDFVREVDNSRNLYLDMLAKPFLRGNTVAPEFSDPEILKFFDRIFAARQASARQETRS